MTNESGPPDDASYAQAKHAHEWRKAIDQYKDRLEQGVEIDAELEKAYAAQAAPSPETLGPIAAMLELLSGRNTADLANLSEAAAARHAELKSALTPERETALRDFETGKVSTLATARIFRSAPQLLDALPDTPLVQKVRRLAQMLNAREEWNGYLDAYWTIGQTLLWIATGDPWTVDQASNRSGRYGETWGQVRAADLIDQLNLPPEHIEAAADKFWERCLDGRMTAIDGQNRSIPGIEWRHLKIVLGTDSVPYILRRGQSSIVPAYEDVVFSRVEVLREFPPPDEMIESAEVEEEWARLIAWIEKRLEAPALRDRTHCRVTEIVDDRVPDKNPPTRAKYFGAFELAVKAGLFNGGKRNRSQLFFAHSDSRFSVRLTHQFLAAYLSAYDDDARRFRMLENLLKRVWIPRSYISRWLSEYGLLPLPSWLGDATPSASTALSETASIELPQPPSDDTPAPGEEQSGARKPRKRIPADRPLGKDGKANNVTVAWDAAMSCKDWATNGLPLGWSCKRITETVNKRLLPGIIRTIGQELRERIGTDKEGNYEISETTMQRALGSRKRKPRRI